MDINIERLFPNFLGQLLPFMLSLLDDALLLLLSRLGLHIQWLQWLSPVILSCMAIYWAVQLWSKLKCKLIGKNQGFDDDECVGSLISMSNEAEQ